MQVKQLKTKFGFTLIELLVVISIIAVLTAVLTANFMGMRERARDAQKIQDLGAIRSALRLYYNDNQSYPVDISAIGTTNYMPSVTNLGYSYTYTQTSSGDGFVLCVDLEAGAGDEDTGSQVKCGATSGSICSLGVGVTKDKLFAVCAN